MKSIRQRRSERELQDRRRKVQSLLARAEYARQRGDLEEALRLHDEAKRLEADTPAPAA